VARAPLHERDEVATRDAHGRVADPLQVRARQQEGVAAAAGVFDQAVAVADRVHGVAGQAAQIADALAERGRARVGVASRREEQRVAAADADVFVVPVARIQALVGMAAQEAGERVAHVCGGAVAGKVDPSAGGAARRRACGAAEGVVVHRVAGQETAKTLDPPLDSHASNVRPPGLSRPE
jgi:hypothetical protein